MNQELLSFIQEHCKAFNLTLEKRSSDSVKIYTDQSSGISVVIQIESDHKLAFYFVERTLDIFYSGDRSDAHVVMSLMFAIFLRSSGLPISSSLFDIAHPVVPDEIWGRYIVPVQMPSFLGISNEAQLKDAIGDIIGLVVLWMHNFWNYAGCPCNNCMEEAGRGNKEGDYELDDKILNKLNGLYGDSPHLNYGTRMRPNWHYVYDIENEVTIIKSPELSEYVKVLTENDQKTSSEISGINGELIVDNDVNNFIHSDSKKEFKALFKELNGSTKLDYPIIPLENMLVAVSSPYIVALGRLSGLPEFKSEREEIRKRHNRESQILFPIPSFTWVEKPCPEQFEDLIKSLLERELNVRTVRKPAPINQGDKSRDLLIEWNIIDERLASDVHPPMMTIKVVGQCKASRGTIGKGKVIDIRDTVETHDSSGYFLAVSTQISAPLTEKLESLRDKGIWAEWWNRDDIEVRLSKNQDLIPHFPKVVKAKGKIKFVDRD